MAKRTKPPRGNFAATMRATPPNQRLALFAASANDARTCLNGDLEPIACPVDGNEPPKKLKAKASPQADTVADDDDGEAALSGVAFKRLSARFAAEFGRQLGAKYLANGFSLAQARAAFGKHQQARLAAANAQIARNDSMLRTMMAAGGMDEREIEAEIAKSKPVPTVSTPKPLFGVAKFAAAIDLPTVARQPANGAVLDCR